MESMKSILPGLILLALVFSYVSYDRSKSSKEVYESHPPSLICYIIGDYGCVAKCTILCALHECKSVEPRCEGHYCNCHEKSSSNAAPAVNRLPSDQNYEFQRPVLQKKEGTNFKDSVAQYLRGTTNNFQDGSVQFIEMKNFTPLLISSFEANELDKYLIDESDRSTSYQQDEKLIQKTSGFTGRHLLQIDEPYTPSVMTVEPVARKVKIERIKKWRKKARMGGLDDDDDDDLESEEVEQAPSPMPKPAEKRRVKVKQPTAENVKLPEMRKNDDVVGIHTDFTAETIAVPREIPQHEDENNPPSTDLDIEDQPPVTEPEDIGNPFIENENVLMEKETLSEPIVVEEQRDPPENQEIIDSPKNETALIKPRIKKSRKKNPKPIKSGPKIQRVKKYRRKNRPVIRRRVKKRKETPKKTDDREPGDSQNSGPTAEAILDGNPSLPSSSEYPDKLESPSELSSLQKSNADEPLNQQTNAKNEIGEPSTGSGDSESQTNGSGNQSLKPDIKRLHTAPNKPRSVKKDEKFMGNIPEKLITENSAKILQPENLLNTIQSQIDEKGGFLEPLDPLGTSVRISDFLEATLSGEPIKSRIPKTRKTKSPLPAIPVLDDKVKLENTQPQVDGISVNHQTDGDKSKSSPLKTLQNIITRPQPSMDNAQQILKKVPPALEEQVTTEPPINTEPYQSGGQTPLPQKENDLGPESKNMPTGTNEPPTSDTRLKKRMRVTEKGIPSIQSSPEPKIAALEPQSISTTVEPLSKNNKPRKRKHVVLPASQNIEGNEDTANEPPTNDTISIQQPKRSRSKKPNHKDLKEFTPLPGADDVLPAVEDLPTPTKPSVGKTRRKKQFEILEDVLPAPENSPTVNSFIPSATQPVKDERRKKNKIIPLGSILEEKAPNESTTISDGPQKQRRKLKKPIPASEIDTLAPAAEQTAALRVEEPSKVPTSESSRNPANLEDITITNKPSTTRRPKKAQQAGASTITSQPKPERTEIKPVINTSLPVDIHPRKRRRIKDKIPPSPKLETEADGQEQIVITPKTKQPMKEKLIDQQQSKLVDRPFHQEGADITPNLPQESSPLRPSTSDTHPKKRRQSLKKVPTTLVSERTIEPGNATHEPIVDSLTTQKLVEDSLTPINNNATLTSKNPSIPDEIHPKKRRRLPEKVSSTPENTSSPPKIEVNGHEAESTSIAPSPKEIQPKKRRQTLETVPSSHVPEMEVNSQGPGGRPGQNQLIDQHLNNVPTESNPGVPSPGNTQPEKRRQRLQEVLPKLVQDIALEPENAKHEPTVDSPIAQQPEASIPSEAHSKKKRRVLEKDLPESESSSSTPKVKVNIPNEKNPTGNELIDQYQHDLPIESALGEPSTNDIRPKKRRQGLQEVLPNLVNKKALEPENAKQEPIVDSPIAQQPEASIPSEAHPKKKHRVLEKLLPEPESSSNTPKVKVNIPNEENPTLNELPDQYQHDLPIESVLDEPSTNDIRPKKRRQGLQEVLPKLVHDIALKPENAKHEPTVDSPIAQQPEASIPSEAHPKKKRRVLEKVLPKAESSSNTPKVKVNIPNEENPTGNELPDQYQHDLPIESVLDEPSTNDIRPKKRRQGLQEVLPKLVQEKALEPENAKHDPIVDSVISQQPESSIPNETHPKKKRRVPEKVSSEPQSSSNTPEVKINITNEEQPTEDHHNNIPIESASDEPSTSNLYPKKQRPELPEVRPNLLKKKALEPQNAKHEPTIDSLTAQQPIADSFIPASDKKIPNSERASTPNEIHPKKRRQKLEKVLPILEDSANTLEIMVDGSPAVKKPSENQEQALEKVPIVLDNSDGTPKMDIIDSNPEVGNVEMAPDKKDTLNMKTSSPFKDTITATQVDNIPDVTNTDPENQHKKINEKAGPQITDHKPELHNGVNTENPKVVQGASESPKDMKPSSKLKDKPTTDKLPSRPIDSPGQQHDFKEVLPTTLEPENNEVQMNAGEAAQSMPTVLEKDINAIVAPASESTNTVPGVNGISKKKEKMQKISPNLEKVASNPDLEITDGKNEVSGPIDRPGPVTSLEGPSSPKSTVTTPDSKHISSSREPLKSDKKLRKEPLAPEVSPDLEKNRSSTTKQDEHKEPKIKLQSSESDHKTPTKTSGNTDANLINDPVTPSTKDSQIKKGEQMLENITPIPGNISRKPDGDINGLTPPTTQQKSSEKPTKLHQTNSKKGNDVMPTVETVIVVDEPGNSEIHADEQARVLDNVVENENKIPEQKTIEVKAVLNAQEPAIDTNSMNPINMNQTPSKNTAGSSKPKIKDPGQKLLIVPYSKEQDPALKTDDPVVKYVMNKPGRNNSGEPQTSAIPNTQETSPEKQERLGDETKIHDTSNPSQPPRDTSAEQDKINLEAPKTIKNVDLIPSLIDPLITFKPPLGSDSSDKRPESMSEVPTYEKKTHKSSEKSPPVEKPGLKTDTKAMSDTAVPRTKEKKLKDKIDVPIRTENNQKPIQDNILDSIPSSEVFEQISKEPYPTSTNSANGTPVDNLTIEPDEGLDNDIQSEPQIALPESPELLPSTADATASSEIESKPHMKTDFVDDPLLQNHTEPEINLDDETEVFESNENNEAPVLPEKNLEVLDNKTMDDNKPEDLSLNDIENSDPIMPSILPAENEVPMNKLGEFHLLPEDGILSTDNDSPDAMSEQILDSPTPQDDDALTAENSSNSNDKLSESLVTEGEPSDSSETGSKPIEETIEQELADTAKPPEDKTASNIEGFDPRPEETSSELFSLIKPPGRKSDETRLSPYEEETSSSESFTSNEPVGTTPPRTFEETNLRPDEEETSSSEFFSLNKPARTTPSEKFDETNPIRTEEEETSSSEFFTLNKLEGKTPSRHSGGINLRPDEDETSSSEFFTLNKPVGTSPSRKFVATDSEPNEEETSSSEFFSLNKPAETITPRKFDETSSRPDGEEVSSEFFSLNKQVAELKPSAEGLEEETDSGPHEDETPSDSDLKPTESLNPRVDPDDTKTSTRHVHPADEQEEPLENQTEMNEAETYPVDQESSNEFFSLNKLMNKVKPLASTIPFKGLDDQNNIIPEAGIPSRAPNPTTLKTMLKPTKKILFGESNEQPSSSKERDASSEFFSFDGKASESRPSENEFSHGEFDDIDSNQEREEVGEQGDAQLSSKSPENDEVFPETRGNMDDEHMKSDEEETYGEFFSLNNWVNKMNSSRHSGWFKEFDEASS